MCKHKNMVLIPEFLTEVYICEDCGALFDLDNEKNLSANHDHELKRMNHDHELKRMTAHELSEAAQEIADAYARHLIKIAEEIADYERDPFCPLKPNWKGD